MSIEIDFFYGLFRYRDDGIQNTLYNSPMLWNTITEVKGLDSGKDCEELKEDSGQQKEVIEKSLEEEGEEKNPKDILDDDDIPYEERMKYVIDSYRKDQKKWEELAVYAKNLEGEVLRLKEQIKELEVYKDMPKDNLSELEPHIFKNGEKEFEVVE